MPKPFARCLRPTRTWNSCRGKRRRPRKRASPACRPTSSRRNTPSPAPRIRRCWRVRSARSRRRSMPRLPSKGPALPKIADCMHRTAREGQAFAAGDQRGVGEFNHSVAREKRNKHVPNGKPPAPDRIDHRMIGAGGGIRGVDLRIAAEVTCQIQCQLDARRIFRKALVDAELEEEGTILMAQYDAGRYGDVAGHETDDLTGPVLRERGCGASDESRIAIMLDQRCSAPPLPAARL